MEVQHKTLKLNDRITNIHIMNLRSLDLNLLVVFDALMRKRNVTHAAQDIGLSQPAFSNALSRLRERLGDELFVRSPSGMRPTAWALELSGPIRALGGIEDALDGASFNPETSRRSFTIATEDYGLMTLIPPLLERVRKVAPGLSIRTITASIHSGEYLDTQAADVALISWPDPPDRFVSEPLIDSDWVCVGDINRMVSQEKCRADHGHLCPGSAGTRNHRSYYGLSQAHGRGLCQSPRLDHQRLSGNRTTGLQKHRHGVACPPWQSSRTDLVARSIARSG